MNQSRDHLAQQILCEFTNEQLYAIAQGKATLYYLVEHQRPCAPFYLWRHGELIATITAKEEGALSLARRIAQELKALVISGVGTTVFNFQETLPNEKT